MSQVEADALTAQVVAEYLRDNPDFFLHRPELVDHLAIPHQQVGSVSLVHVQLNRQRQRIDELEEEITSLMSLAATNDVTFHSFMDLQQQMFKCTSLDNVFLVIKAKAKELNLRAHLRLVDGPTKEYSLDHLSLQRFATNHFNGKPAYLGRLKQSDRVALFGDFSNAPEFGSYVVLPLRSQQAQGILAFSSEDGGHFQPSMDTLFLCHLSQVLIHLMDILPWRITSHD